MLLAAASKQSALLLSAQEAKLFAESTNFGSSR